MRLATLACAFLALLLVDSTPCLARQGNAGPTRVPITRDTWFSNVGPEADGNNGGSPRIKLKSHQEMALVDFDPAPFKGRTIRSARLHVHLAGPERLGRVTVSGFGAPWVEGTGESYAVQPGSSSHNHRKNPNVPWSYPGSDLTSVILGSGGTAWRNADATAPTPDGWQTIAVGPEIIAQRIAGISEGLLLYDDTGSEWTRAGEKWTPIHMPNRLIHSRESPSKTAPYLTIDFGPNDRQPPAAPTAIASDPAQLPAGEAWISWKTPADTGPAGTVGFFVKVDGRELPRYLIPRAGRTGEAVKMRLQDVPLKPGSDVLLSIRAVDGAGNVGSTASAKVRLSSRVPQPLPGATPKIPSEASALPRLGTAEVAVIDELDKIQPLDGSMIPQQSGTYLSSNHIWNAKTRSIRLHAARNEFIGIQVAFNGVVDGCRPSLVFDDLPASKVSVEFGRYVNVESKKGPLPDPIEPLGDRFDLGASPSSAKELLRGSLYAEIYVGHDVKSGEHRGKLTLKAGADRLVLDVSLHVWDFTLPDSLSFIPEMNCYGLPENDRDYYRLAHRHRTLLNRVPYSQRGEVAQGFAPVLKGKTVDWTAWDARFGPLFDGSAFADLPRKSVPIEGFYLPVNENWPDPIDRHYNGTYWADRAFTPEYRRDLVTISRQFAEHLGAKRWDDTLFQFFLNGKNDFKSRGWSHGSSPWLLDEPSGWQDFDALLFFGRAFHEGIDGHAGQAKVVFRCDISRPQWRREVFDGLLDYNVIGGAFRPYRRMTLDRKDRTGELVIEYSSANPIEDSNVHAIIWSLDSWSLGSDGVLPWQTVGTLESWKQADPLALFYPGKTAKDATPVPSIRLKAYRRGQQDVEYLTLLSQLENEPRWAIGAQVRDTLRLVGERRGSGLAAIEDVGLVHYGNVKPQDLWAFRVRIGESISKRHPPAKQKLIDLRTPPRTLRPVSPPL